MNAVAKGLGRALVAALAAGIAGAAGAAALTDAERRQVCAEAVDRYRQMAGKAPTDEPFTVILMYRDIYCPAEIVVKQGARLRWINVDRRTSHSVWFKEAGRPESDRVFPEEFVEMTIDLPPGEYPYLCGPHATDGMTGRLVVTGR